MKTIVFVSSFLLEFVDFEVLRGCRLVLLDTPQRRPRLPVQVECELAAIHLCDPVDPADPLSGTDYASAREAVLKEVAVANGEVHVLSFFEFNVELAARLATELGLHAFRIADYRRFRDKTIMKQRVAAAGLRAPRFQCIDNAAVESRTAAYFAELEQSLGLPFICKPIDAAGSVGVHKVASLEQFLAFQASGDCRRSVYEAEEFIDGTLFHCDFVVHEGKVVFRGCGEYFFPCFEASKGKIVGSILLPAHDPEFERVMGFAEACLDAFEVEFGAYHMEVFRTARTRELVFLEVGARPPGLDASKGYLSLTDVSMPTLLLRAHLGMAVQVVDDYAQSIVWGQIPAKGGTIRDLRMPATEGRVEVTFNRSIGDTLVEGFSYFDVVGKLGSAPHPYAVLRRDFELIREFSFVTVQ